MATCTQIPDDIRDLVAAVVRRVGAKRASLALGLSVGATLNLAVRGRSYVGTLAHANTRRAALHALLSDADVPRSAA